METGSLSGCKDDRKVKVNVLCGLSGIS